MAAPAGLNTAGAVASSTSDSFDLAHRLVSSERLRRRRYEVIALRGPGAGGHGAPHTEAQGRGPSADTSAAGLADLISSIGLVGVLQPVLIEELPDPDGGLPRRSVVAGERRLRACRWGAAAMPDNPHFEAIPAVICPGPLSPEERYIWQLAENLAREGLRPGELGAALMFARCALLTSKLLVAGVPVPGEVVTREDPVARFAELEKIRARVGEPQAGSCGASWSEVLRRIGIQMSSRQARAVAAAFRDLPREVSAEMDEHQIRLGTRQAFLRLHGGHADAAAALWQAVKQRRRPELLPAATRALLEAPLTRNDTNPTTEAPPGASAAEPLAAAVDQALDGAALARDLAAAARGHTLRAAHRDSERPRQALNDDDDRDDDDDVDVDRGEGLTAGGRLPAAGVPAARTGEPPAQAHRPADPELLEQALRAVRELAAHLRAGHELPTYAHGSLQLLLEEICAAGPRASRPASAAAARR